MGITLPWASVVVPTYGEKGVSLTRTCLESLNKAHGEYVPEVIVVSDGDEPPVLEKLEQLCIETKAKLIANPRGGFSKACNSGISLANGGLAVFLVNNDIEFIEPALLIMADAMNSTDAGIVGCRLLYPNMTVQHAGVFYAPAPEGSPVPGYFDHFGRNEPHNHPMVLSLRPSLVTGALMGISRWYLEVVGQLDERFKFAVEDLDACLNCMEAGRKSVYLGYTYAIHHEGASRGRTLEEKRDRFPELIQSEIDALVFLHQKWGEDYLLNFRLPQQ